MSLMRQSTSNIQPGLGTRLDRIWQDWRISLPVLLAVALLMRISHVPYTGYFTDMESFSRWGIDTARVGLAGVYRANTGIDYPPIYMAVMGIVNLLQASRLVGFDFVHDSVYVTMIKVVPLLADLALITIVYWWVRKQQIRGGWLIPAVYAISPVLIVTSAAWGQSDSSMLLIVCLAVIALNQGKPLATWAFAGVGMLLKYQTVVLLPVLAVATFLRYGWRKSLQAGLIAVCIFSVGLAPIAIGSGLDNALRPYIGTVGHYAVPTQNAFNIWLLLVRSPHPYQLPAGQGISDDLRLLGPLTIRQLSLAIFGAYMLLVLYAVFRQHKQRREFVWAAAAYLGFFMLPTEMHERYLIPGALLAVVAVVQDRRMWLAALGLVLTCSYNLNQVFSPQWLPGLSALPPSIMGLVAALNIVLLIEVTYCLLTVPTTENESPARFSFRQWFTQHPARSVVLTINRVVGGLLALAAIVTMLASVSNYTTAAWISQHTAPKSQFVFEVAAEQTQRLSYSWNVDWFWNITQSVEEKPVAGWRAQGAQYLLIDEATSPENFDTRVQKFIDQGALLAYRSQHVLSLGKRQAVLFPFRPGVLLNNTFDNTVQILGYDLLPPSKAGDSAQIRLYWILKNRTPIAYHAFIHLFSARDDKLVGQADTTVGGLAHPVDTWQRGEVVYETVTLPSAQVPADAYPLVIRLGLYRIDTGERATVQNDKQEPAGDHIEIALPNP